MQMDGERSQSPLAARAKLAYDPLGGTPGSPITIAQYLPGSGSWGDVDLDSLDRGLGGRETALIHLGKKWAEKGHHVRSFVPIKAPKRYSLNDGCLEFLPLETASTFLRATWHDVILSWEKADVFDNPEVVAASGARIIGMQVAHLEDMGPLTDESIDRYVVLSPWAGEFLSLQNDAVDFDKIWVVPNGVDLSRYPEPEIDFSLDDKRRLAGRFFYSSSPDRGLNHLLRIWPKIVKEIPHATLSVAYGPTRWTSGSKFSHSMQGEVALDIEYGLQQAGVFDVGVLGQRALAELQIASTALLYPCDTMQPTETGCITVTEAMAAGAPAIISTCDCLPSEYGHAAEVVDLPIHDDRYVEALLSVVHDPVRYGELQAKGRMEAERRSWENTSTAWLRIMEMALQEKT